MELYTFDGFNYPKFTQNYLYEISPHDEDISMPRVTSSLGDLSCNAGVLKHYSAKRGVKNEDILRCKVDYLIDVIIRRAFHTPAVNALFSLNSKLLKAVIGDEYKPMLKSLEQMGYIRYAKINNWSYKAGEYSYLFALDYKREIIKTETINFRIIGYRKKTKDYLNSYNECNVVKYIKEIHGEEFYHNYVKSLSCVKIADRGGLQKEINEKTRNNPNSEVYYQYVIAELSAKNKKIYKVDKSGRIYHCLTNLDRNLKQYLNFDIALDCKNSHPVLFNFFIFHSHGISAASSVRIIEFIKSREISGENNLRKLLIANNIEYENVAKLADDELYYIYITSIGRLWDDITARHPEVDRNEVKKLMFAQVFYSKTPYIYKDKDYAEEFKRVFPTVYRLISDWKRSKNSEKVEKYMKSRQLEYEKLSTALPIAMMNLEAQIFTTILKNLYNKRWKAIHIHDCIVIPYTKSKYKPTKEEVLMIMLQVYRSFGLSPTFDETNTI